MNQSVFLFFCAFFDTLTLFRSRCFTEARCHLTFHHFPSTWPTRLSFSRARSRQANAHDVWCCVPATIFASQIESGSLSQCFFNVLTASQNLHIIDYSLSQTTLEQVFLSFADKQKNSDLGAALGNAAGAVPAGNVGSPPGYSAPPGYSVV